jgi:hypothetical protein
MVKGVSRLCKVVWFLRELCGLCTLHTMASTPLTGVFLFLCDFRIDVCTTIIGLGQGVTGAYSGGDKISLHRGSLVALQEHAQGKYPGMKVCFASSADTTFAERIGRATLKMLEVLPGMTVWDLVMRDWDDQDVNQIGRKPPLSRYGR